MENSNIITLTFSDYDHEYNRYADITIFIDELKVCLNRAVEADASWEEYTDIKPEAWTGEKTISFVSGTSLKAFVTSLVEELCRNCFNAFIDHTEESNREIIHKHCRNLLANVDDSLSFEGDNRQRVVDKAVVENWADYYNKKTSDQDKYFPPIVVSESKTADEFFERAESLPLLDHEGRINDYHEAIKLNPKLMKAYACLATSYYRSGNTDEALKYINRYFEDPDNLARAYRVRSWIYEKMEKLELAIHDLGSLIELEPDDNEANKKIGELRYELGDLEGALSDLKRALEICRQSQHREIELLIQEIQES